jgi:Rho termination factor, N-terminal domain
MVKDHGPSVKDDAQYEALRKKGTSKEKAARIANASAKSSRSRTARKGGKSATYEDWSRQDLYQKAREVGIEGRSSMGKKELVAALRKH